MELIQRRKPDTGRRAAVVIALAASAALWFFLGGHKLGSLPQVCGLVMAGVLAAIPAVARRLTRLHDRLLHPAPRTLRLLSLAVFLASTTYLNSTAVFQGRDFFPKWHDQHMHLVQAQMLARGRLWMPAHPLADFFETFYVFVKPVYAGMYFPGTALLYVPAIWLHLPFWLYALLIASAVAVVLFRVVTELAGAAAGLLAAVMLLSLAVFRRLSLWVMSHPAMLLLGLCFFWSWLRWRRRRTLGWAAAMGFTAGWAAITRPLDAVTYALPVGLGLLWDLRTEPMRRRVATVAVIVATALPFISLQLVLDKGVTGSFLKNPFAYYQDLEWPGLSAFGSGGKSEVVKISSTSQMQQKKDFFLHFILPLRLEHWNETIAMGLKWRIRTILQATAPSSLLLLFLPLGLLGLRTLPRAALFLTAPTFLGVYLSWFVLHDHYCTVIAPGVILALVLSVEAVAGAWPRWRAPLGTWMGLSLAAVALGNLPEFNARIRDDSSSWPIMKANYEDVPAVVKLPAVVLYRYESGPDFHEAPVYNIDVAWPDDAPIIRAHDLGPRNVEIFAYYAARQPDRHFYLFDRGDAMLTYLGTADELAHQSATQPAATAP